jgi:3-oxoacyl-[acyl-carrier-protein] synthase-3
MPVAPLLRVRIGGTGSSTPGRRVSTAEYVTRVTPRRDAAEVEARTGIATRYVAPPDATFASLGADALRRALDAAGLPATVLRRLIYVNSTNGDMVVPATSNLIADRFGLAGSCDCFDMNNGCMGFVTAIDLAARTVVTGGGAVAVVSSEMGSRCTTPEDPRPFLVFGDGAAAAVLTEAHDAEGILGVWLRNHGAAGAEVTLANGVLTHRRETVRFGTSSGRMTELALDLFRRGINAVLEQSGLALDDIEWVVPHQPNGSMLAAIIASLGIDRERVVPVVQEVGSLASASIGMGLDRLMRTCPVRPGDRILMAGVGAGLSCGAILYRVGP